MKFYPIALLGAATVVAAQPHAHNHAHLHARHGSPVEARDNVVVTETAPGPVVTVYELNGQKIPLDDVEEGLKEGKYVLIGGEVATAEPSTSVAASTSSTPTPTPTPTPSPSPSTEAAKFFQKPSSSSSSTSSTSSTSISSISSSSTSISSSSSSSSSETPTSTYVPPTSSAAPSSSSTSAAAASSTSSGSSSSGSSGSSGSASGNVNAVFTSGTVPCSEFPSEYGPVPAPWLGLQGWTGVQEVPDYNFGVDKAISYISTATSGSTGCHEKSFCSYACPAGYQKTQWPTAQGSAGQSIGGLYCNSDGYLELSNKLSKTLCEAGVGGVEVINNLDDNVAVCRTDYPGTESETIALDTQPGITYPLTCPDANTYYKWEDASTSAQYYINPDGVPASKACTWGEAGGNYGNWAPVNAGVGRGTDGVTYLSIFPNAPTNPDGTLDYAIDITGDVSGKCSYSGGKYYSNGAESPTGCTVAVTSGGTAVFEFNKS